MTLDERIIFICEGIKPLQTRRACPYEVFYKFVECAYNQDSRCVKNASNPNVEVYLEHLYRKSPNGTP